MLVDVEGRTLKISNLDKVLYPRTGTTKGEVLNYYAQISPVLLPHLADRASPGSAGRTASQDIELLREEHPRRHAVLGAHGEGPDHRLPRRDDQEATPSSSRSSTTSPPSPGWSTWPPSSCTCTSGRSGRNGRPRNADRLVIDLDPGEPAGLHECCQVALLVSRQARRARSRRAKPVTSGSKGLHLYADLPKRLPSQESTALAKEVAEELQKEHPTLVTATMTKARRRGKVFLDWSQNSGSKTTISPYSLRGKEQPYVATPLGWDEVEAGAEDPDALEQFRFDQVLARVEEYGDLFE